MILRLVMGQILTSLEASELVALRARAVQSLRGIRGMESVIVGIHESDAIIASVWRDPDSMLRVTGAGAEDRFVPEHLGLALAAEEISLFQILGRTFTAMPPESVAYVRTLRVRAPIHDESRLIGVLRNRQDRLMEHGLVTSHLGSRMVPGGRAEAVHLSVWPTDHPSPESFDPMRAPELVDWRADLQLTTYDGVEIAPRLPDLVGPPVIVLDDGLRIVDLTGSAAAALGLPADELVGRRVDDVRFLGEGPRRSPWPELLSSGVVRGETEWAVPDIGAVRLHILGRRDTPVAGRHAIMVSRIQDAAPEDADLDAAIAQEFSG